MLVGEIACLIVAAMVVLHHLAATSLAQPRDR